MRKLLVACFLTLVTNLFALEVDEKLTLRILKVSSSNKTILINRGQEDGLAEGDHAKFFTTSGVAARAMLVKVSPQRSIWSVYRVVTADQLKSDQVMSLKISTPVKVTADSSKALGEPTLKEDTTVITSTMSDEDRKEFMSIGGSETPVTAVNPNLTAALPEYSNDSTPLVNELWEIWGTTHIPMMSQTTEMGTTSVQSSSSGNSFGLGMEKYFDAPGSFLNNFSLQAILERSAFDTTTISGAKTSSVVLAYGGGFNWHFYAPSPHVKNTLIGFLSGSMGIGSASDEYGTTTSSTTSTGSVTFMSLGVGAKFFVAKNFGVRGALEYYQRAESYTGETEGSDYTRSVAGPRVLFGLSYRF